MTDHISHRGALVALAFAALSLSCSLQELDFEPCASDDDCVSTYGLGARCEADGFCSQQERCTDDTSCATQFGLGSTCGSDGSCTEPFACTDNASCRQEFGWGSVCGDTKQCRPPEVHPRCSLAYPDDFFDDPIGYRADFLIGALYDYEAHADTQMATELAIRQANAMGGLEGREFAMVTCDYGERDDGLDSIAATEEISRYLASTLGAPVIVGPRGSSRAQAAYGATLETRTLVISPSATSPTLTALDGTNRTDESPGTLWRTAPPDTLQASVVADDMLSRGVTSVAMIFQTGAYGEGLVQLFSQDFVARAEAGVVVDSYPFTDGMISEIVADVSQTDVDEVLFVSSNIQDTIDFLIAATATSNLRESYDARGIFLTDAAFNQAVIDDTEGTSSLLFDNIRGTRPTSAEEQPLYDAFAAAFQLEFNAEPNTSAFTAHAYDAGWLAVYGTAWALFNEEQIGGVEVARGLRQVSSGRDVQIRSTSWSTVIDEFRNGRGINVQGTSGSLDYDPSTEETTAPIEVWSIAPSGGSFEFAREYVQEP